MGMHPIIQALEERLNWYRSFIDAVDIHQIQIYMCCTYTTSDKLDQFINGNFRDQVYDLHNVGITNYHSPGVYYEFDNVDRDIESGEYEDGVLYIMNNIDSLPNRYCNEHGGFIYELSVDELLTLGKCDENPEALEINERVILI